MAQATLSHVIAVRLSGPDYEHVAKAAASLGTTVADYARMTLIGGTLAPVKATPRGKRGNATLESPRLKAVYEALKAAGDEGVTGFALAQATNGLAIATSVSEIRRLIKPLGEQVLCFQRGTTADGRKVYLYKWSRHGS